VRSDAVVPTVLGWAGGAADAGLASVAKVARVPLLWAGRRLCANLDEGSSAAVATMEGVTSGDSGTIARLGLTPGLVIQEFGYDDDCDEAFRDAIQSATGEDLVDEGFGDVTDGVIVWFRDGDDDLADLLMDVQTLLDDGACVWLLTPKSGVTGHVTPRDVGEAASLAGLHQTSSFVIGESWTATQLVEKGRSK